MNRLWTALTVLAAIAVFWVAGYVIAHDEPVPTAGQAPGYSQSRTTPTPSTSTSPPSAAPTRRLTVAFLGDDYTSGEGATARAARFSTLICAALHLTERNFGNAGSGYAVSGVVGGNYLSRIDEVIAAHPDVVLVSGGRNDAIGNARTVATGAKTLFARLHRRLPNAVLVAVAPLWGDSPPLPALAPIAASIRAAVRAAGGSYLAINDPLRGHPRWMADLADPNNAGYAAIEGALEAPLGALLVAAHPAAGAPSSSSAP